jgi:hypothetical protein
MKRSAKRTSNKTNIPSALDILDEVSDKFFDAMRRPPGNGDRLFHWSYCYSDSEFNSLMIRSLIQAKLPQRLIYIYDRTGFLVSKDAYKRLTKEEKQEIRNAGLEYDTLAEQSGDEIYKLADYDETGIGANDPLQNALYVFGNFIERNVNSGEYAVDTQRFVCAYLVVRTYRIIRAIFRSQKYTTTEEALVLVRSLYEIYCKLVYAVRSKRNAKYLLDSDFGLITGDYEILIKDGKPKRSTLINRKTKRQIPRTRSFYEYISASAHPQDRELFEVLYEYLSSFVHSGSRHILKTWADDKKGFLLTHDNDEYIKAFVLMLTCLISSMTMQSLLTLKNISGISRWDMSLFCFATRQIVMESASPDGSEIDRIFPKLKARAAVLPSKVRRAAPS